MHTCRTCMRTAFGYISIFEKRYSEQISTTISNLTSLDIITSDGLPDKICDICIQKLDTCTKFITMCQDSDKKLRTLFIKSSDEESQPSLEIDFSKTYVQTLEDEDVAKNIVKEKVEQMPLEQKSRDNKRRQIPVEDTCKSNKKRKAVKQQCFTCGKVMSSRFRLKTHLRTHTGERPFSCPHCDKTFSLDQNLRVHMRVHTGEKPLQCPICDKTFAHHAGLTSHKRKHTGQTPYQCMLCPRSFRTNGHLKYHVRLHTGEKNFECDTCGKAFITRSGLKQHLHIHTGYRPYVCPVCDKRLTQASHLKRHIQQAHNNQFACTMCTKKFMLEIDFEKHKETHNDEKLDVIV